MRPGVTLRATRLRGRRVLALWQLLGLAALAGCGSSAPTTAATTTTTTVSSRIVTPSGLGYAITVTERGGQACSTERYFLAGPKVRNFPQTTRFCGPVGQAVPPRLIQVARPAATLIVDQPARCAPVAVGRGVARPGRASSKCSLATPHLRVTLVPAGHRFTIAGIAGVRTLDLATSRCSFICTRVLSAQTGP